MPPKTTMMSTSRKRFISEFPIAVNARSQYGRRAPAIQYRSSLDRPVMRMCVGSLDGFAVIGTEDANKMEDHARDNVHAVSNDCKKHPQDASADPPLIHLSSTGDEETEDCGDAVTWPWLRGNRRNTRHRILAFKVMPDLKPRFLFEVNALPFLRCQFHRRPPYFSRSLGMVKVNGYLLLL